LHKQRELLQAEPLTMFLPTIHHNHADLIMRGYADGCSRVAQFSAISIASNGTVIT
jgi:hypothetical protein